MKHKFLMTIGIMFGVGLLLCGIGGGIMFVEAQSFTYEGQKYPQNELTTDTVTVKLPEGKPVYYSDGNFIINLHKPMEIILDEEVPQGEIHAVISHTSDYSRFKLEINNEYFIWNDDMLYISEHPVYSLSYLDYDQEYYDDDFENFREIMQDIKERKIYDYNRGTEIEAELHINPADEDRLIKLNDSQSFITYREYKQEYAPDPESPEAQQEIEETHAAEEEVPGESFSENVIVVPVPNENNSEDQSYAFKYQGEDNKIYATE